MRNLDPNWSWVTQILLSGVCQWTKHPNECPWIWACSVSALTDGGRNCLRKSVAKDICYWITIILWTWMDRQNCGPQPFALQYNLTAIINTTCKRLNVFMFWCHFKLDVSLQPFGGLIMDISPFIHYFNPFSIFFQLVTQVVIYYLKQSTLFY